MCKCVLPISFAPRLRPLPPSFPRSALERPVWRAAEGPRPRESLLWYGVLSGRSCYGERKSERAGSAAVASSTFGKGGEEPSPPLAVSLDHACIRVASRLRRKAISGQNGEEKYLSNGRQENEGTGAMRAMRVSTGGKISISPSRGITLGTCSAKQSGKCGHATPISLISRWRRLHWYGCL